MRVSLRRPIDKDKHIREIDGLRLLAVAAVVVSHIAPSVARHYQDVTGVKTYDDVILRFTREGEQAKRAARMRAARLADHL